VLGRVWYVRDETERRVQEAEQRRALDELLASHDHQAFLLQAAEIISQAEGYTETLERLAAVAVPVLADLCLVDALMLDGRVVRVAASHSDPAVQPLVDELRLNYGPDPSGVHPSIEVMHTGRARWSESMSDDFLRRTSRDERHYALLKRLGFTSYMTLPLVADNQILGSITLVSAGSGRRFGHSALALADDFTSSVAQVVAAAHRNDSARQAAHTLQASLLPEHLPEIPGLELAVRYLPATINNDVGGDFYDVITGPAGVTTVAIGDVAGHDMKAAAIMGKIRTAARVLAGQATGPRHFIEMLRHGWDNLELERMATLLIASIDEGTGQLRIASAGHPPPLLVESGEARLLDVKPTTPLGAPASEMTEWSGTLAEGATLLLFTDGLVEDRRRSFHEGAAALLQAASVPCSPDELCGRVLDALVPDETHHDDDIAMVAVRRRSGWRPPAGIET
jgi:serine/threonine-protein kinase RsbW